MGLPVAVRARRLRVRRRRRRGLLAILGIMVCELVLGLLSLHWPADRYQSWLADTLASSLFRPEATQAASRSRTGWGVYRVAPRQARRPMLGDQLVLRPAGGTGLLRRLGRDGRLAGASMKCSFFRRLEAGVGVGVGVGDEWHGTQGLVPICRHRPAELNPVLAAFIEAACADGLAYVADAPQCPRQCPDEHRADLPGRRPRPPPRRVRTPPRRTRWRSQRARGGRVQPGGLMRRGRRPTSGAGGC